MVVPLTGLTRVALSAVPRDQAQGALHAVDEDPCSPIRRGTSVRIEFEGRFELLHVDDSFSRRPRDALADEERGFERIGAGRENRRRVAVVHRTHVGAFLMVASG